MIRLFFLLILFLSFNYVWTQRNFESFLETVLSVTTNDVEWPKTAKNTLSKRERESIKKILSDTVYFQCYESEYFEIYLRDFYFIDLDGDSDLDILYNGRLCPGYESELVVVYINKEGKYIREIFHNGRILDFDRNTNRLLCYSYPCCSSFSHIYSSFSFGKDNACLDFSVISFAEQLGPNNLIKRQSQLLNSDFLTLDKNTELFFFSDGNEEIMYSGFKNLMGVTNKVITVSAYDKKMDKSGVVWYYMAVKTEDIELENNEQSAYFSPQNQYLMLWIRNYPLD
ncbi:MAG: hypothetical protein BGO87_08625 [Flavobacteriia bacterium 40-80]|mgnify:CR=1 FL=1|nr:MAG: hypothetical protein BGO87_08625 [Flavobacteriia bacterium 40-80]